LSTLTQLSQLTKMVKS